MAKGLVKFDEERCKGCELCVSVCPVKIIALHETKINSKGFRPACVLEADKCIGCANCAIMCPDGAISVFMREEGDEADE
ncbi:MAG: 4Fe-4S dicluster domain-containing protein [Bacillota bacterium]|jgi:2-oxoglutarate ferredoxin oxidoreductase subunit delta|nr:4Fe-4S dicluster domain-containing protein [Bacillota bacterium]NLM07574.1 4Fe-4S binding protein [Clostridiales Family XIII bacterium]HOA42451.1 4Fe-4S dicluster domain-containing protein [Bacillota bacterium]HPZ59059.1 4Fe-4S dicluster domain-containing protein [Bacillota bacterium]HQC82984.1 4Fe-4S dicluster domain-containing protein [Bacillota bacterium]